MTRYLFCALLFAFLLLFGTAALCGTFDERLWEKYAEISPSPVKVKDRFAGVYLEPRQLGNVTARIPFADLRVVTDRKVEVPWQIVTKRPEMRVEELPTQMRNLSSTGKNETWIELLLGKQGARASAMEIITPNVDFSRQVQVLGSPDGKTWNTLRKDGVIFDINRGEKLHHTRVTFPPAGFRYLALKIANGDAQSLNLTGVKVFQETDSRGETYSIQGTTEKSEINAARKESSLIVRMEQVFPLDRLIIETAERNFQRCVEVQIKRESGAWEQWAQGTIFNFNTAAIKESQMAIDMPEVAAREFRLVFKNFDSPSLSVSGVTGEGYRRVLVFDQQPDRKLYLFWGNPQASQPRYDLAGLIEKQKADELPIAYLGQPHQNTMFAGNNARLPFTERYKYLLFVIVTMAIAALIFLQYRVLRGGSK